MNLPDPTTVTCPGCGTRVSLTEAVDVRTSTRPVSLCPACAPGESGREGQS